MFFFTQMFFLSERIIKLTFLTLIVLFETLTRLNQNEVYYPSTKSYQISKY